MDKLTKIFQSGEVLKAQDLNSIKEKVNELVDGINSGSGIDSQLDPTSVNPVQNKIISAKIKELQEAIENINLGLIIAEDIDAKLSLNSVIINDGASTTTESSVSMKFSYNGTPTHYMLSESPSFTGASWISFTNPASFILSGGEGNKTVYAKIKDASTESISKNDSITYSPVAEVSLSSININNGAEITDKQTVSIVFAYSGNPTHFMLSESPAFAGASWAAFSNPATFVLSTGEGPKTVYAKIKDATKESSAVNDSINYSIVLPLVLTSISINSGAASTSEPEVSVQLSYTGSPTHYMLSEDSLFIGASWIAFTNPASFALSDGDGSKTVYAKIKDASGESAVKNDSITYAAPVVGSNIAFTDPVFKSKMVQRYDKDGDGEVSYEEAKLNFNLGSDFLNNTLLVNANELKHFINSYTTFSGLFSGCTSLTSIEYPAGWDIKSNELKGCTSLSHVVLPNDLETIPNAVFEGCASLESITLPSTLKTLGSNTFNNSGLLGIKVPNSVTDVGQLGYNCTKMTWADLGSGVTSIGINAFVGSPIETLICRAVIPPTCGYAALKDITAQIYVPDESVDAYKTSTPWWSAHASRIHPLSEYQG